jgi:hypothetical protein
VRITCEGVVKRYTLAGSAVVLLDGGDLDDMATVFAPSEQSASTFSMEVIPRALEVGDRVTADSADIIPGDDLGEVVWLDGLYALVRWPHRSSPRLHMLSDLKPLEPSSPFQGQGKQGLSPASAEIAVAPQVVDPDGRHSAGQYRCTRCGRDEIDGRANGCERGPCPMEFVG